MNLLKPSKSNARDPSQAGTSLRLRKPQLLSPLSMRVLSDRFKWIDGASPDMFVAYRITSQNKRYAPRIAIMPKLYEALADAFLAEGVDTQFVLMGDGNMHWSTAFANCRACIPSTSGTSTAPWRRRQLTT